MMLVKDPKNFGYIFENIIHDKLKNLECFDEILYEKELKKRWGWEASSVDYLLIYDNNIILIQVKWRKTRRRESVHIHNFIKSINHIMNALTNKNMVMGLWISRREPFEDNKEFLSKHNIRCIYDFHSMNKIASDLEIILRNAL